MYAVRGRVDLTEVSDAKKVPDVKAIQLQELLPTSNDTKELQRNFSIPIARTLKKHMPFFKMFGKGVERHIEHQFQKQTSQKSEVVSCCYLFADVIAHRMHVLFIVYRCQLELS